MSIQAACVFGGGGDRKLSRAVCSLDVSGMRARVRRDRAERMDADERGSEWEMRQRESDRRTTDKAQEQSCQIQRPNPPSTATVLLAGEENREGAREVRRVVGPGYSLEDLRAWRALGLQLLTMGGHGVPLDTSNRRRKSPRAAATRSKPVATSKDYGNLLFDGGSGCVNRSAEVCRERQHKVGGAEGTAGVCLKGKSPGVAIGSQRQPILMGCHFC